MVNFQNYRKQKLMKDYKIEQNESIMLRNFVRCHEITLKLDLIKSHIFCLIL
jgi:hypothetical protein